MDKKNILPQQGKPVMRSTTGKLPSYLAELSEEALGGNGAEASYSLSMCSCDGAEASYTGCLSSFDGAEASYTGCLSSFDE
ncbi:microcyclamide/patellamide family RiPP [Microcoleus sp. BROC3]|uniref:microcyclamide/patellamide family RiPP n=1 Tax=Microcoleus sp. BROC3 TaxID=3055323 RepID=UPI002FD5F78E